MRKGSTSKWRVGIAGITGYTGQELVRLVSSHPQLDLVYGAAHSSAGTALASSWPGFAGLVDLQVEPFDAQVAAARCDIMFTALPHGHAANVARGWLDAGLRVVDLGADFRLRDPMTYAKYYGMEHPDPSLIDDAVYALVEWEREALTSARLIANPGCYPTAVGLGARPMVEAGLLRGTLVASCLSGVSGAGRAPNARNRYCETNDAALAYGIAASHRHTPEIEQFLGVPVVFTPHLAPMNRGILASIYVPVAPDLTDAEVQAVFQAAYAEEAMVVLTDAPPSTAHVRGSNRAFIHAALDAERQVVTVCVAIDNLVKGASGQAIQALNVSLGIEEGLGLPLFSHAL